MRRLFGMAAVVAALVFASAQPRARAEDAGKLFEEGIQALKDSQTVSGAIVRAARAFARAEALYEAAGDTEKAVETNSYLFWCKKKMSLADIEAFTKSGETATLQALDNVERKDVPIDSARAMYDKVAEFAAKNPNEHFLIAVRFYEIAERFKGTPLSLEAQDQSLKEQQQVTTAGPAIPSVKLPPANAAVPAGRQPVPPAAEVSTAQKSIRDIFKAEYAPAAPPETQAALPAKIFAQAAIETDVVTRYALFREAIELAVKGANAPLACRAVDALAQAFEVDPVEESLTVLGRFAGKTDPAHAPAVAAEIQRSGERALAADNYAKLPKFSVLARNFASRAGNKILQDELQSWARELDDIVKEWASAGKAVEKIAASPNDPGANLALGRFYLFYRGDWERSFPALARGSDEKLKTLALHELALPQEPSRMAALADDWFSYGEKERGPVRSRAMQRVVFWEQKALPELAGLEKLRVEKRFAEIAPVAAGVLSAAESGTGKPALRLKPRVPIQVELFACCDDYSEVRVNDRNVLNAGFNGVSSARISVQRGDTIAVKVQNNLGDYGFACVLKSQLGFSMASTRAGWRAYKPANPDTWWNAPESTESGPLQPGNSPRTCDSVGKSSGVRCEQVWPPGVGEHATGYLYCVIAESSFQP